MSNSAEIKRSWKPLLRARVAELEGSPGDALAIAMRLILCQQLDVQSTDDGFEKLVSLQRADGGWEDGWFYKYGSSGVLIANRGLTTAFALKAISLP